MILGKDCKHYGQYGGCYRIHTFNQLGQAITDLHCSTENVNLDCKYFEKSTFKSKWMKLWYWGGIK